MTIVMPKHSADSSEMRIVLEIYNEVDDWLSNETFINLMRERTGPPIHEPQAYTKKTQINSYFGFLNWEDPSNSQSKRRISESGKRFLAGLKANNEDLVFEEILKSLESRTFGRNVLGVNSNSDLEPPQLFIKCVLILGYLKRQEFGYILEQMDVAGKHIIDLLSFVSINRKTLQAYSGSNSYYDAKPITALINWNFFQIDGKENGQEKIVINPKIVDKHINRLQSLSAFNNLGLEPKINTSVENDETVIYKNDLNIIFYGAPGTGKSFKVNELVKSKESRVERVTFHPDYDYASFVGSFKPIMGELVDQKSEIRYEFSPQIFTNIYVNAWNDLSQDYYLVIEEINRGNCSEIFGDIFQLLDRNSDYTVTPSKELQDYLARHLLNSNLVDPGKLKLPPNLSIFATMNTSDQSLFHMDSAFKRRWDWEYIHIDYEYSEVNVSSKYLVQLSDEFYFSWLDFILKVNLIIKNNPNLGMDKCIGNYFLRPNSGIVDLKTFINKVIFYLWDDVFKDEIEEDSIFKNGLTYEDFFPINEQTVHNIKIILSNLGIELRSSSAIK
jgi:hypothetical protein